MADIKINKYSKANKKRWAGMSKLERSECMRKLAVLRHAKMSQAGKKALGAQLANARRATHD